MANTLTSDRDAAGTLAYELVMRRNYRSNVCFSSPMIAKAKPTNLSHDGDQVRFWFTDDLAAATTPLTENVDVTPQAIADRYVDITINPYGATVGYTEEVLGTDMLPVNVDAAITAANQAVDTYETLARNALVGGTNVTYVGQTAQASITASDTLGSLEIRTAVAQLRGDSVPAIGDNKYLAIVHPDTALDLQVETGDAAWITSRNYQDITGINSGFIGTFAGAIFYETPRVAVLADAGASAVDVYQNVVVGPEALAMAYARKVSGEQPMSVVAPVVDKLRRMHGIGWKWFGGFDTLRQESCRRIESASSIGDNA